MTGTIRTDLKRLEERVAALSERRVITADDIRILDLSAERQARADQNSERHAQSAEERVNTRCLPLEIPVAECTEKEVKAAEDARRS
jgi:hypothetical protein